MFKEVLQEERKWYQIESTDPDSGMTWVLELSDKDFKITMNLNLVEKKDNVWRDGGFQQQNGNSKKKSNENAGYIWDENSFNELISRKDISEERTSKFEVKQVMI